MSRKKTINESKTSKRMNPGRHHSLAELVNLALSDIYGGAFKDADDVRSVMRSFGHSRFVDSEEAWKTYKANLGAVAQERRVKARIEQAKRDKDPESVIDNPICPVCGGHRRWPTPAERVFVHGPYLGQSHLWVCDSLPDRPWAHFIAWATAQLAKKRGVILDPKALAEGQLPTGEELLERERAQVQAQP